MNFWTFHLHVEHESLKHVVEYSTSRRFEQVGQNKSIINYFNLKSYFSRKACTNVIVLKGVKLPRGQNQNSKTNCNEKLIRINLNQQSWIITSNSKLISYKSQSSTAWNSESQTEILVNLWIKLLAGKFLKYFVYFFQKLIKIQIEFKMSRTSSRSYVKRRMSSNKERTW